MTLEEYDYGDKALYEGVEDYDYEDYGDDARYEEEGEEVVEQDPEDSVITSISSEFTVDLGDDLRLPCRVKKSVNLKYRRVHY